MTKGVDSLVLGIWVVQSPGLVPFCAEDRALKYEECMKPLS